MKSFIQNKSGYMAQAGPQHTRVPAHGEIMVLDPTGAGWRWSMEVFFTKVLAEEQVVELQLGQNTDFVNTNNHQHEQLGGSNSLL